MDKKISQIKSKLHSSDPKTIAKKSGADLEGGNLYLKLLGKKYVVDAQSFEVTCSSGEVGESNKILILDYLSTASPPKSQGKWISFRELPNGAFYSDNFKRNTEGELSKAFQGKREEFAEIAAELGGEPISMGDAGFSFQVFPKLKIALVFWEGGEEFTDTVNVLFQETASDCLPEEGLSLLGKKLCGRFLGEAKGRNS